MGFYSRYILPRLIHQTCRGDDFTRQRRRVVPQARGVVLEIGLGSGLNLPFYDPSEVHKVVGVEPSEGLLQHARETAGEVPFEVEILETTAEELPLPDAAFDSAVVTYTLCSIPDVEAALREVRRVLKPGGALHFCEHGAAPDPDVHRWQNRITPLWKHVAGGCRLNRPIPRLLEDAGFHIEDLETAYLPGWRPGTFNYWGRAARLR